MKRWFLSLIIIVLVMISGCGIKNAANNKELKDAATTIPTESSTVTAVPIPVSNAQVEWECGTYYSDISLKNMEEYLSMLKNEGWKDASGTDIMVEIADGTSELTLSKEDKLLQILMFLVDRETPICNSILVKYDEGVPVNENINSEMVVSKEKALERIQSSVDEMIKQGQLPSQRGTVCGLFEIFIKDAFDKMGLQAYAAISENGFIGCFLIRPNLRAYVPGDLKNACVVDIDQDGKYELMDLSTSWSKGIYKVELSAYEYYNPIYFSSLTEILQKKYYNCFVPESGYESLQLRKIDENTVMLVGEVNEYGIIAAKGNALTVMTDGEFPYVEWSLAYDQNLLLRVDKIIPKDPPEIMIDVDGLSLDYIVKATKWNEDAGKLKEKDAFDQILKKEQFIPTIQVIGLGGDEGKTITINFGQSIPDSIRVYDAMLEDDGKVLYGDKLILEQAVKIIDNSKIQIPLGQHFALALSSSSEAYNKDWYRLFRVECKWLDKECNYAFLINTGLTEELTEISDHDFLSSEGTYSKLSSNWGIGLNITSENLPEQYILEWRVSDGSIKSWDEEIKKPIGIIRQHQGFPMTSSEDWNKGGVIWIPLSYDAKEVTIEAYLYESPEDRSPIGYSKVVLENVNGSYQEK